MLALKQVKTYDFSTQYIKNGDMEKKGAFTR
jgi:hypothetical protein